MTLGQEKETLQKEARPGGTRFAAITLMILLVLVGIYLVASHTSELKKSPLVNTEAAAPENAKSAAPQ